MKRLIIDGNSVYEIDLDCVKRHRPSESCELAQHLKGYQMRDDSGCSSYLKEDRHQDKV